MGIGDKQNWHRLTDSKKDFAEYEHKLKMVLQMNGQIVVCYIEGELKDIAEAYADYVSEKSRQRIYNKLISNFKLLMSKNADSKKKKGKTVKK